MKRTAVFLIILFLLVCNNISFAAVNFQTKNKIQKITKNHKAPKVHTSADSAFPLCTDGNLVCVLGKYTFTSNNINDPIYVSYGIMCTSDGGLCTNGEYILQTNSVIYR